MGYASHRGSMQQPFTVIRKKVDRSLVGLATARQIIYKDLVLVDENVTLEKGHLDLLNTHFIKEIYVRIPLSVSRKQEPLSQETVYSRLAEDLPEKTVSEIVNNYNQTLELVKNIQNSVDTPSEITFRPCQQIVDDFNRYLGIGKNIILQLLNNCNPYNYLFTHSLNVSIYAMMLGKKIGCTPSDIQLLGIAGIFHDLGMLRVKNQVWQLERELTENEFFEIMRHPIYGADIISGISEIPVQVRSIVYQHHERMDGSGYPKALNGDKISRLARIFMVADAYEAATSERTYRHSKLFHYSIREMISLAGTKFDKDVVRALVTEMSLFPVGSFVKLSDDSVGKVISTTDKPDRPLLKIIRSNTSRPGNIISLMGNQTLRIVEVLDYSEEKA